ncbi:MAG: hypothetical protein HC914_20490 [Chloroflexaceae bacterium]|nr:hypothetical protein [Chloroflexaceae bacterium]
MNLVLTHKAEQASGELRYDHPRVRLAAARALRVLLARFPESTLYKHTTMAGINWTAYRPQDIPAPEDLVSAGRVVMQSTDTAPLIEEDATLDAQHAHQTACLNGLDATLIPLFVFWSKGTEGNRAIQQSGHAALRIALESTMLQPLERAVAAFALGDLAIDGDDATLLIHFMMQPPPAAMGTDEWQATTWAAAEALTLFDADLIAENYGRSSSMMEPRLPSPTTP